MPSPHTRKRRPRCRALSLLLLAAMPLAQAQGTYGLKYAGVNLSGAEVNSSRQPGVLDIDYHYPAADEYTYFAGKHMNTVRLPILW
ncbi:glycoside hydrolase family 5 protein, partial [Xanthomonas oryzae pv. oryzicola]